MAEQEKIKGSPPGARDSSWLRHAESEIQSAPARLEETAKFLVGLISICLTIFITNSPDEPVVTWVSYCYKVATGLWLLSALLAFFVLYPMSYKFNLDVPAHIKTTFNKITKRKRRLLQLSLVAFLAGLLVSSIAFLMA